MIGHSGPILFINVEVISGGSLLVALHYGIVVEVGVELRLK